jgi:hypothetical protein
MSSGEALPVVVAQAFLERFPTTTLSNVLSTTETAADACALKAVTLELCEAMQTDSSNSSNNIGGDSGDDDDGDDDGGGGGKEDRKTVNHVPIIRLVRRRSYEKHLAHAGGSAAAATADGRGDGGEGGKEENGEEEEECETVVWGNAVGKGSEDGRLLVRGWNVEHGGYLTKEAPEAFVPRRFHRPTSSIITTTSSGRQSDQLEIGKSVGDGAAVLTVSAATKDEDDGHMLLASADLSSSIGSFLTGDRAMWRSFSFSFSSSSAAAVSSLSLSSSSSSSSLSPSSEPAPVRYFLCVEGRVDDVVKVRGHRVDLAGVEAAVLACSEWVEDCAALAHDDTVWVCAVLKNKNVKAASSGNGGSGGGHGGSGGGGVQPELSALTAHLKRVLPSGSRPALVAVDKIHYGRTGKKDRKRMVREALPSSHSAQSASKPSLSTSSLTTTAAVDDASAKTALSISAPPPPALATTATPASSAASFSAVSLVPKAHHPMTSTTTTMTTTMPTKWGEEGLCASFERHLGLPARKFYEIGAVDRHANFFELGGNSFKVRTKNKNT